MGGNFGPNGPEHRGVYTRRGGGDLTDENIIEITKRLGERSGVPRKTGIIILPMISGITYRIRIIFRLIINRLRGM